MKRDPRGRIAPAIALAALSCGRGAPYGPADGASTAEVCDGVDNDGDPSTPDGAADPLFSKPCGFGDPCGRPRWTCDAGFWRCLPSVDPPAAEARWLAWVNGGASSGIAWDGERFVVAYIGGKAGEPTDRGYLLYVGTDGEVAGDVDLGRADGDGIAVAANTAGRALVVRDVDGERIDGWHVGGDGTILFEGPLVEGLADVTDPAADSGCGATFVVGFAARPPGGADLVAYVLRLDYDAVPYGEPLEFGPCDCAGPGPDIAVTAETTASAILWKGPDAAEFALFGGEGTPGTPLGESPAHLALAPGWGFVSAWSDAEGVHAVGAGQYETLVAAAGDDPDAASARLAVAWPPGGPAIVRAAVMPAEYYLTRIDSADWTVCGETWLWCDASHGWQDGPHAAFGGGTLGLVWISGTDLYYLGIENGECGVDLGACDEYCDSRCGG